MPGSKTGSMASSSETKEEEESQPLQSLGQTTEGMEVIYVVIARRDVVLAEYTRHSGNYEQISRVLLKRMNEDGTAANRLAQLKYDAHVFHYSILDGITYMCMTDASAGNRRPFAFLTEVSDTFRSAYGPRALQAIAYEFNADFSPVLRQKVEYHLTNVDADSIGSVKARITDARDIMVDNIERLLERGEKIELLVNKTEAMTEQAFRFEKSATKLKIAVWWKRVKIYLFIFFIIALLAVFIAVVACGFDFANCAANNKKRLKNKLRG